MLPACKLDGDWIESHAGAGTRGKDRRSSEGRSDGAKLMLRLLLHGLIGVAAYRIGSEFLRTIPSDFEPVPAPAGNPEQSRTTDQGKSNSESRGGDVGDR
jgi:hypothetical protein